MRTQVTLKIIIATILTFSQVVLAAPVSRVTNFSDSQVLTAAQLNSEFNNLISGINSISDAQVASNAAISPSKISATIKGDAIARDGSTGTLSVKVDDSTIEISGDNLQVPTGGITETQLADEAVTTAKIDDGAVTQAKREALNLVESSGSGTYSTTSNTVATVTNLSISFTSTGRPVLLTMLSTATGTSETAANVGRVRISGPSTEAFGNIYFARNGNIQSTHSLAMTTFVTSILNYSVPCSSFVHIENPGAGTYTYTVRANMIGTGFGNNTLSVSNCKLVAYEL